MADDFLTEDLVIALRCQDEVEQAGETYLPEGVEAARTFADAFEDALIAIEDDPLSGELLAEDELIRRRRIGKTPFYLYYELMVDSGELFIFMCRNQQQEPLDETALRESASQRRSRAVSLSTGEEV